MDKKVKMVPGVTIKVWKPIVLVGLIAMVADPGGHIWSKVVGLFVGVLIMSELSLERVRMVPVEDEEE